jgi:hypothetical protein
MNLQSRLHKRFRVLRGTNEAIFKLRTRICCVIVVAINSESMVWQCYDESRMKIRMRSRLEHRDAVR